MSGVSSAATVGKRVVAEFSEKNVSFMAAGIAYNAFISLAPLLILLLLLASVAGGGLEARLIEASETSLPEPIAEVVTDILTNGEGATSASIVGIVVVLWGTLKIFRGLDTAFSEIYETDRDDSFVDQIVDGVVVLAALVVSVLATVVVSALFARFADVIPYLGLFTPLLLVGGLILAFLPMYYRFPDADVEVREILTGVLFAAVGWAILQSLFQVYLTVSGGGSESFFGGVIVVVTWLYFSGLVILLGAVLNAVVGGHSSGAPGGVGRGAGGATASKRSIERDETASYLRELRTRLTGYQEKMVSEPETVEAFRRPRHDLTVTELDGRLRKVRPASDPGDDVTVMERSRKTDDGREYTVTLHWTDRDDDGSEPGSGRHRTGAHR